MRVAEAFSSERQTTVSQKSPISFEIGDSECPSSKRCKHRYDQVAVATHMSRNNLNSWVRYFDDIGLQPALNAAYLEYVSACLASGIPPIFEGAHLAKLVGRHEGDLMSMVFATPDFYREFRIKKRTGGFRSISAPYPSLLEVQRWIKENVLSKHKFPNCVVGYRSKRSIIDNARIHCNRETMLKIDLEDFFPSIDFRRVAAVFNAMGYPTNVAFFLSRLCTLHEKLPQGGATSPTLSNIICKQLDARLYGLCGSNRLRYTRYADDIVISGKTISKGLIRLVHEIVAEEGFRVNNRKTRILGPGDRKIVTGLDISSGRPRVTRQFRRDLQKDVYFVWKDGLTAHMARRKLFEPNYIDQLTGRLAFWKSVEPQCRQMLITEERVAELIRRYRTHSMPERPTVELAP